MSEKIKKQPPAKPDIMDCLTCAADVYAFLAQVKKSDIRSMREIARVAGVNQYTAYTILSGKAATGAAIDNVLKLAAALGCGITIHSTPK